MDNLKTFIKCLFGPRVYSFYKLTGNTLSSSTPQILATSHAYAAKPIEVISDSIIKVTEIILYFGTYFSPILLTYYFVYKRNYGPQTMPDPDAYLSNSIDKHSLIQIFFTTVSLLSGAYMMRAFARYTNPEYRAFIKAIEDAKVGPSVSTKRILNHINADFRSFPVDFRWSEARDKRPPAPYEKTLPPRHVSSSRNPTLAQFSSHLRLPLNIAISIVMKTIGRRLIYPGSLGFLQALMDPAVSDGRSRLIETHGGIRHKLEAFDGNHIDSMFVDRRGSTPNGDYLVIGCEGNGAFYELGTILTPLEAGYSVLGWNHPGFGGSTGVPYPDQEVAAVDVVVQFALDNLSFAPSQIVLYGWSIGGFTASWAAMRHPNIHGVVIDASFDDIMPLALNIFPRILHPIVEYAIRRHFDLDNSRHLENYDGPVLIVRRSQDEVIATNPFRISTNRSNHLLYDLIAHRFPELTKGRAGALLMDYLSRDSRAQNDLLRRYNVSSSHSLRLMLDYSLRNPIQYPMKISDQLDECDRDRLVLFLASKHMVDYDSVHCAPLPAIYFQRPYNLINVLRSNL